MAAFVLSPLATLPIATAPTALPKQTNKKTERRAKTYPDLLGLDIYKRKQPSPVTTLGCSPS